MKSFKNIVIAGYPKSGNTWLSRLVAELVGCPVSGFWRYSKHPEIAVEGDDRKSNYRVYKSHHQYYELSDDPGIYKIIYIVRDPRDIVVSGTHYFCLRNFKKLAAIEKYIIRSNSGFLRLLDQMLLISSRRSKKMTEVVLNGDSTISRWLEVSWDEHVSEYLNSNQGVLVVKYEDLVLEPIKISKKILGYIGLCDKKQEEIEAAVRNQSFEYKKKKFKKNGDTHNIRFMRQGGILRWKDTLSKYSVIKINLAFNKNLRNLNYDV